VDITQRGVWFPELVRGFPVVRIVQTDPVVRQFAYLLDTEKILVDITQRGVWFPELVRGFPVVRIVQTAPVVRQFAYLLNTEKNIYTNLLGGHYTTWCLIPRTSKRFSCCPNCPDSPCSSAVRLFIGHWKKLIYWVDITQRGVWFPDLVRGFPVVWIVQTDPVVRQFAYLLDTERVGIYAWGGGVRRP
jgi:L-amino acid N-acyltransferase YncA